MRELGVGDVKTLWRWADELGYMREEVVRSSTEQARQAAAAANARVAQQRAEARERTVERLLKVRELALVRELEVLVGGGFSREDLRDLTFSRTKAVHDSQLLESLPTSIVDDRGQLLAAVVAAINAALARAALAAEQEQRLRFALALELRKLEGRELPPADIDAEATDADAQDAEP